jgi:hypothetical protein
MGGVVGVGVFGIVGWVVGIDMLIGALGCVAHAASAASRSRRLRKEIALFMGLSFGVEIDRIQ